MDAPLPVSSVRVLTINTHKGYTALNRRFVLPEMRDAIRAVGADLVFLQEVQGEASMPPPPEGPQGRGLRRSRRAPAKQESDGQTANSAHPSAHPSPAEAAHAARTPPAQHEYLADRLWPQFAYGRNAVTPHGHHGNAVLSKYPIVHSENRDVSIGRTEQRGLLHCVLAVPGLRHGLHAICVHLGLLESHRQQQAQLLCDMILDELPADAPLVVAGDFNDWRHRVHRVLARRAGLTEVFQRVLGRSPRTFPARWPVLRLDRIYVRNARALAPMTLPRRPWSHLSDHVPLAAEVRL
jgi:endonuclease/exonuclease/phosphatase family metal-dependent hydrolase